MVEISWDYKCSTQPGSTLERGYLSACGGCTDLKPVDLGRNHRFQPCRGYQPTALTWGERIDAVVVAVAINSLD